MLPDSGTLQTSLRLRGAERGVGVRNVSDRLAYLTRVAEPLFPDGCEEMSALPSSRRLLRITGIGRDEKFGAGMERAAGLPGGGFQLPTADFLAGLHGFGSSIAFVLTGDAQRVTIDAGVWTHHPVSADQLEYRGSVFDSVLRSLYPVVTTEPSVPSENRRWATELVLGVPTVKAPTPFDGVLQYDRLVRSLTGEDYQVVVLAQPLAHAAIDQLRDSVIGEMRSVREAVQAESLPSPVSEHYLELLKKHLGLLSNATTVGAWRTAVYLRGDERSLARLSAVWRSTFSGTESVPDAIRTYRVAQADGWAQRWSLPQVGGNSAGPSQLRPFELQTVLTSDRLAAYVHLPEREVPGFAVDVVARFDSVIGSSDRRPARSVQLGAIVAAERVTSSRFELTLDSLTKHVLVCGVTGSGKSTTIRRLLIELARNHVPFLVLEPAKAEYRSLADHAALRGQVRVFTVGDEQVSPLRINPLAPNPGSSVAMHLDLLKSLFSASFGLWAPLPQILESCLHELYADYGWNPATNENRRLSDVKDWDCAFPTLTELRRKIDAYIDGLGYVGEVTANMRAALSTRIDGLTVGGKGRMFDNRESTSSDILFEQPVILELERLADEEDQAFLMGLLLIRLAQHRRLRGRHETLQHLLVVEEAHRLLARPQGAGPDMASPKTKAVESFANLLAETRAYGQGVLIADQVPVKLAPEVIKNSNLKVTHRLVADDDRMAVGSSMVMDERQRRALATLRPGQAAVFAEGHDAPLLVQVPPGDNLAMPSDHDLAEAAPAIACQYGCTTVSRGCTGRGPAVETSAAQAISRLAQTLLNDRRAAVRSWPEIEMLATIDQDMGDAGSIECFARRQAAEWAHTRGAQYAWPFDTTAAIARHLAAAITDRGAEAGESAATAFATGVRRASMRRGNPFPRCAEICPDGSCLHRHAVAAELTGAVADEVRTNLDGQVDDESDRVEQAWIQAAELAARIIEFPSASVPAPSWWPLQRAAVAATLCTAQQALITDPVTPVGARLEFVDRVLTMAPRPAERSHESEHSHG